MRWLVVLGAVVLAACAPLTKTATTVTSRGTVTPPPTISGTNVSPTSSSTSTSTTATIETTTTSTLPPLVKLEYQEVARLGFPVQMTALPGAPIAYIITKDGRVWAFEDGEVSSTPVLDIRSLVRNSGEQGLLSIAVESGYLYLHYSDNAGDTVVSRFELSSPVEADPGSERVLLEVDQPAANHNGGMIVLVGDVLYVGLGDGGGANDTFGNGQNQNTLLAGIVSISTTGDPAPALFAYGLRNPWRFWIDNGLLYVADVGQSSFEEVSVTEFVEGKNFGWPVTEGLHCFRQANCDTTNTVIPLVEISHGDAGTCSITGGVVYRGSRIPEIAGAYLYSDYCGGYLRSFRVADGAAVDVRDWTQDVGVPGRVVGFGVDGKGEIYVMTTNAVYRLTGVR